MLNPAHIYAARHATEAAAIASATLVGHGDKNAADKAAVDAMRASLNNDNIRWRVVIGEGERDKAPMLYMGEELGTEGADPLDLALDPLEGTTLAAEGAPGALSVLAAARPGALLNAPDVYMRKLAVGANIARDTVSLDMRPEELVESVAAQIKLPAREVTTAVLDRPRHRILVDALRRTGCRVNLFGDGDVAVCLGLCLGHGVHLYLGTGGAPEGVLSATALSCLGGYFEGQLIFRNDDERARADRAGIQDLQKIYAMDELARGELAFVATGVTTGALLDGACVTPTGAVTESLVLWNDDNGAARMEKVRTRRMSRGSPSL